MNTSPPLPVRRLALLGGESTGKTTLARALAEDLHTAWVPEYGRQRWEELRETLSVDELVAVARRQIEWEDEAASAIDAPGRWLICDTTPLTTLQYCLHDHGWAPAELQAMARRRYDLVVLCDADFDFVQDGCRRDDGFRQAQQNWTLARLAEMGVPCLRVHGSPAERVGQVLQALTSSPVPVPIPRPKPSPRSLRAPPKTLLVEDHAMVRESLLLLLDQRLPGYRWREAGTLAAAFRLLQNEPDIDLLLLDLDLPDSRGLDTLKRVRDAAPQVSAVVLSAHDDRDSVLAAIDHGAAGFLSKTVDAAQLVDGVRRVLEGGVVLPAVLSRSADAPGVVPELSERQRDVLRLLIAGHPNKLIGRALGLSDATVKTHLQLVYRKLQVESRTQAVLAAARWRIRL